MASTVDRDHDTAAIQQRFRVLAVRVERGLVSVAEAVDLARRLAPSVLDEVVSGQLLARQRNRQGNLRVLRLHLEAVARQGMAKRVLAEQVRLERAFRKLRKPGAHLDPQRWLKPFTKLEDDVLRRLAKYAALRMRHPAARHPPPDRERALQVLLDVASIVQMGCAPRGEQLALPFEGDG